MKVYTNYGLQSCYKVVNYLKKEGYEFEQINISNNKLTYEEVRDILLLADNGTDDILSDRSKYLKDENPDIENMKVSDVIRMICKHPTVLKLPLVVDDGRLFIGFNSDQIEVFKREREKMCVDYYDDNSIARFIG